MNDVGGAPGRPLRVALNARSVDGPFGGANQFAKNIAEALRAAGHVVVERLEPGLDVILIIASHDALRLVAIPPADIAAYKKANPGVIVIQRVNASDEQRGGSIGQNQRVLAANRIADHTLFVSAFMRDFWAERGIHIDDPNRHTVIHTGADESIFHPRSGAVWDGKQPFRLVTHHWSSNFLKGFDYYERLDTMLGYAPWKDRFAFTYVGNMPAGFAMKNAKHVPPTSGSALADILRSHHGYVTAARFEPGGNHYIEAIQCGLPVLHLDHGSLVEYCGDYGVTFDSVDFPDKLEAMRDGYAELRSRVLNCPYGAAAMSATYVDLMERLVAGQPASTRTSHPLSFRSYLARKELTALRRMIGNWLAR